MVKGADLGGGWRILHRRARAADLHAASAAVLDEHPVVRTVTFMEADGPALVLGHHQDASSFDPVALRRAGVEVARRRTGGSAVLVGTGRVAWVDFVIPAGDPLWDADVGRAAGWVGRLWADAIAGAVVWEDRMRRSEWSDIVCFAGVAAGEVLVSGRKVVGVCQRRTAAGALFQTAAAVDWRPEEYTGLLARPVGDERVLAAAATGLGAAAARAESAIAARLMP